jgi:serine/threonine-protein kinase ULK2
MEYCGAGDLSQHLRKNRVIKEIEAQTLLQQLTSALKVLWENNLIHRDLKPQNLLLKNDPDHGLVLKIADFGFARYVEPTDLAETLCGSPLYMVITNYKVHFIKLLGSGDIEI